MSTGYVYCAHAYCFTIVVGKPGDLCEACRQEDAGHDHDECNQCDNDSWADIEHEKPPPETHGMTDHPSGVKP